MDARTEQSVGGVGREVRQEAEGFGMVSREFLSGVSAKTVRVARWRAWECGSYSNGPAGFPSASLRMSGDPVLQNGQRPAGMSACGRTANGPAGFGDPALHTAADLASGHRQGTPKASEGGLGGRIAGRPPRCRYARQASAGRFNPMGAEGGHPARVGQAPERRGK